MARPTAYLAGLLKQELETWLQQQIPPNPFASASHSECYLLNESVKFPELKSKRAMRYVLARPIKISNITSSDQARDPDEVYKSYDEHMQEQKKRIELLYVKQVTSQFLVFPIYDNGQGLKIMPYYAYGDLHNCITRNSNKIDGRLEEKQSTEKKRQLQCQTDQIKEHLSDLGNLKKFIGQLLLALEALHEKNIAHLDLSWVNVLLDFDEGTQDLRVGLADFGQVHEMDANYHISTKDSRMKFSDSVDCRKIEMHRIAHMVYQVLDYIDSDKKNAEINKVREFLEEVSYSPVQQSSLKAEYEHTRTVSEVKQAVFFGETSALREDFFSGLTQQADKWLLTYHEAPLVSMLALEDAHYILPVDVAKVDSHVQQAIRLIDLLDEGTTTLAELRTLFIQVDILQLADAHHIKVACKQIMADHNLREMYPIQAVFEQLHYQVHRAARKYLDENLLVVKAVELQATDVDAALTPVASRGFFSDRKLIGSFIAELRSRKDINNKLEFVIAKLNDTKDSWSKDSLKAKLCQKLFALLAIRYEVGKEKQAWQQHHAGIEFIVRNYQAFSEAVMLAKNVFVASEKEENARYAAIGRR